MIRMKKLHEKLSREAEEWIGWYARFGVQQSDMGLTQDIIDEFEQEDLQLPQIERVYRVVVVDSPNKQKNFIRSLSNIESLYDLDTQQQVKTQYKENRVTSWSLDKEIAIEDFAWQDDSYLLTTMARPEDSIIYFGMLPFYPSGMDQSEVILKPGIYNCTIEKV